MALIQLVSNIASAVDNREPTAGVFLDLSKLSYLHHGTRGYVIYEQYQGNISHRPERQVNRMLTVFPRIIAIPQLIAFFE